MFVGTEMTMARKMSMLWRQPTLELEAADCSLGAPSLLVFQNRAEESESKALAPALYPFVGNPAVGFLVRHHRSARGYVQH